MFIIKEENMSVPLKVWSEEGKIEQQCLEQMKNVCKLPFLFRHVSLMPDGHLGIGASIGSVVATKNEIIVNLIGVDQGCGLIALKTSLTNISKENIRKIMGGSKENQGGVRTRIPLGFNHHSKEQDENFMPELSRNEQKLDENTPNELSFPIASREYKSALKQIGTLGGGNHFWELQKGSDGHIWLMIHSGSRNLGLKVATYYAKKAYELNQKWNTGVEKDLSFFPADSREGQIFLAEMKYSVDFALANRKLMADRSMEEINKVIPNTEVLQEINIAHNYVAQENHFGQNVWVHRKGATLARKDTIGIIPGSMGTKSYIVQGKGNPESFMSCSHGAGRLMSRTQAKNTLDLEKEKKFMDDQEIVHGLRNKSNLDEASSAYKDIDEVMKNQEGLVEILVELTPIANIKG